MIVSSDGNEENNLKTQINIQEGEDKPMGNEKIKSLMHEVEVYKQAVQDAEDALASAEMELDELLEQEFNQ